MTQTLGLTTGWTDLPVTVTNSGNNTVFTNFVGETTTGETVKYNSHHYGWRHNEYWYPYYYPMTQTITVEREVKPVKLTMSEVESLRVAAKKDKSLKATLEKFTKLIEVVVDFA